MYSIKKKVHEISESYGGLSFMPQSFFVSIFLGEATRSSLRASNATPHNAEHEAAIEPQATATGHKRTDSRTALSKLRHRRFGERLGESESPGDTFADDFIMSPAGRVASLANLTSLYEEQQADRPVSTPNDKSRRVEDLLGDSLLGPQDIAVLLQAGLTSAVKGSTVVQLNQRSKPTISFDLEDYCYVADVADHLIFFIFVDSAAGSHGITAEVFCYCMPC